MIVGRIPDSALPEESFCDLRGTSEDELAPRSLGQERRDQSVECVVPERNIDEDLQ